MPYTKYNFFNPLLMTMLLVLTPILLSAQDVITGKVMDGTSGDPLIGASIVVQGVDGVGTITDFDGNYTLNLPDNATSLVFSYTGYSPNVIQINGRSVIDVELNFGEILEDIVVVGYGTIKREDATGSVQSVSAEKFNKGAITGAQELLAGKIAGVSITPDAAPGGGATIRIRGLSSLGASSDPLIVIDGVPIDNSGASGARNPLNILNPNDIETFTVLKDASATAIYGSRASAGVILITTKKGDTANKLKLSYSGNVSNSVNSNRIDILSADEFREQINSRYVDNPERIALMGDASTDWQNEIYQNALAHDHTLSASGGIFNIPYRVAIGYTDKQGVLKTDRFNRLTSSVNLTPGFLNNTLQIKANFKSMHNRNDFADQGAIGSALSFDPTQSVRTDNGLFNGYTTVLTNDSLPQPNAPRNPVSLLEERQDESSVNRYISTFNADYRLPFMKSLRVNLNLAYDISNGGGFTLIDSTSQLSFNRQTGGGTDNTYESRNTNSLLETYVNYKEAYGKHLVDVIGGYSWQHFKWTSSFRNSNLRGTPTETNANSNAEELYLISLFGRLNYNFNERLYASFVLRRDGTSRFSPDTRWGIFPAASLAMKFVDNDTKYLNYVKLRAGWGVTGQQDIGRGRNLYAYQGIYETGLETVQYQFGDRFVTTIRPNGYAADIKWEETTTYNVGLDFNVVKNKLTGTIDVYQRLTKDILATIPAAAGTNLTNEITTNVGNMENRGIEFALDYTPFNSKDFQWNIGANVAYNENKITRLTATDDPDFAGVLTGGISGGVGSNIQIHSVGFSPNTFFVFEQMYDENGNILEAQFVDRNEDGIINDDDKYRAQNPFPRYTYGITNNVSYKSFDLAFAGRANFGNYIYNNVQTDQGYLERLYNPAANSLININSNAVEQNLEKQGSLLFSDAFVSNGSFFRLDHVTLGYNSDKLLGEFTRIFVTVQNPLLLTNYQGLDPEIYNGIDNNLYPRPTTYLLGINVSF